MANPIIFWAVLSTIKLMVSTYQDHKKMMVDDRHNYFMVGATIMLLSYVQRGLMYMLPMIILIPCLIWFMKKSKALGEADLTTISWLMLGYGIISIYKLIWFLIFFVVIVAFYAFLKFGVMKWFIKHILKQERKIPATPFYGVLLTVAVFTNFMLGVYFNG